MKAPPVSPIISLYGINFSYDHWNYTGAALELHYSSGPALQIVFLLLSIQSDSVLIGRPSLASVGPLLYCPDKYNLSIIGCALKTDFNSV